MSAFQVVLYWFTGVVFGLLVASRHTADTNRDIDPWAWILVPVVWPIGLVVLLVMAVRFACQETPDVRL